MSFIVFTDSAANLPLALAQENNIHIIPLSYYTDEGEQQCLDPSEAAFDGEAYYAEIHNKGMKVTTSQISPDRYINAFRPELDKGGDILFVAISSGISGTYASAAIAAQELREEYPGRHIALVDALGASLGEGLIALRGAELCAQGVDIEDTALLLREMVRNMCQVFTVDDLLHLRRGGRLSNISAIVGTVLNIKPILKGDGEGHIVAFKKIRGRRKSIAELARIYDENAMEPEKQTVGIAQAACREEALELAQMISEHRPPREILHVQYEPVTGAHVGPGALALFFLADDAVRDRL